MNTTISLKLIRWSDYTIDEQNHLLIRPAASTYKDVSMSVSAILDQVQHEGDKALHKFNLQFDHIRIANLRISETEIKQATNRLKPIIKQAIKKAFENIDCFHQAQKIPAIDIETQPGVHCYQLIKPINSVGFYIPGGSVSLLSTVLMLAIPARLAGCQHIVMCSPPPISDTILYVAMICGIKDIYQVGGAQAIAAMAFGTESIIKVNKIFGPGNQWVTEAKRQVSAHYGGVSIDMPAGPSELLVIADHQANSQFIAADLLSQAEHGHDSQVILLTPNAELAQLVVHEIKKQLLLLSRAEIIRKALTNSYIIIAKDLEECINISNRYGPEHLIIQAKKATYWLTHITNAGSVFLGDWSPEAAGDYASGTNHIIPTYGYTKTYSSLGLKDFQKNITVQQLNPSGLLALAPTIETLAQAEQLTAHKNAVRLRIIALKDQT